MQRIESRISGTRLAFLQMLVIDFLFPFSIFVILTSLELILLFVLNNDLIPMRTKGYSCLLNLPDLAEMISSAKGDQLRTLNLLRGFIFYLSVSF